MVNRVVSRLRVGACLVWLRSFVILNVFGIPIRQLKAVVSAALFALLFVEVAGAQVPVVTAVNDVATVVGGTVGATTVLSGNDIFPAGSVFTVRTGSTCTSPISVSTGGIATYTVPASGTCTVNYRLCAPAPNTTVCSNATLTVTITVAGDDDSFPFAILIKALTPVCSAFTATPASVLSGGNIALAATCTNSPTAYEWYRGTTLLGTTTTATFPTIAPTTVGTYEYAVVAKRGNIPSLRKTASVNVSAVPPLSVSAPTSTSVGSVVSVSGTFIAPANSANVRVTVGGTVTNLPNVTGSFSTNWTPTQSGVYQVRVEAISIATSQVLATNNTTKVVVADKPSVADMARPGTSSAGATAGGFGVSDMGSAQYSIPISIPPGIAGMQPSVSLNYSNTGGNGYVGVGWSMGGLSAIVRCPKTIAQDGARAGINYDNDGENDVFCMDGQRLIPIGSPSLITGTAADGHSIGEVKVREYRTEIDRFDRILSYEATPNSTLDYKNLLNGPTNFKVYTKSGQIMEYGTRWWSLNSGASQMSSDPNRGNVVQVWPLDKVADRNGNYYVVDYSGNANVVVSGPAILANAPQGAITPVGAFPSVEFYPAQITYTFNKGKGITQVNRVVFEYGERPDNDRHVMFDSGAGQHVLTKRLERISTYVDGALIDFGNVAVTPANFYPICAGSQCGTKVKEYRLAYDPAPATTRSRLVSVEECAADGICLPKTTFAWTGYTKSLLGTGSGFINVGGADVNNFEQFLVADINGDGRSDLVCCRRPKTDPLKRGMPIQN